MTEKEILHANPNPLPTDGGRVHKVRIGASVPPLVALYMDKAIEAGLFANRSDFVTQAIQLFIEKKKEEIDFDKILQMEVRAFYEFIFREK